MNGEVETKASEPKLRLIDYIVLVNERAEYLTICEDARQKSYGYRYAGNDVEAEKYRALGRFLLLIESRYGEVKQLLSRKPRR
jgi:hypothetical protein